MIYQLPTPTEPKAAARYKALAWTNALVKPKTPQWREAFEAQRNHELAKIA